MNNNFMGFYDPTHNNAGMNPDFGRGPPGQQGGFGGLPPNMAPHGGMNIHGFQHHQRLLQFESNQMMGRLSPGLPTMPTPGSGIGPPSAGRMMEMNFSRMQHYRAAQQSHIPHSPGSLSPMPPGMAGGPSGQGPYGLRMPSLTPKQQMLEARLQSSLGNGITRWPRMPSVAGLSRPQMPPQLLMNQGPMPMLQNTNDFQLGGSPTLSNADMMRFIKMDNDDAYAGPGLSMNSLDFPPSHPFPPNQNPYSMDSQLSQPPPLKQSPLSFGQPQSLSYGPPVSKSFVDSYPKFMHQLPHSPKLTHFGPSPSNDIFDQPGNPLTPLASQQKSPFSPFGNTFSENMNSPVGLRNMPQALPLESSSPVMQTSSMDIRSPTKVSPLLSQMQQLKQQIAQIEGNPLHQGTSQLPLLKQQLEHTYMQFISQQRSNEFSAPKDSNRMPQPPQDFYLDKPPMTPRSQSDFSLDKPPPTPRPAHLPNEFRMEKVPKASSRSIPQNDFSFEKGLSQPHLHQDFLLKKSPQTPIGPAPHQDIFDKPPMTPRPAHAHDFIMDKAQQPLSQGDYILDKPPSTPRQKGQAGFVFGKPPLPLTQPQLPTGRGDNFSQPQLHLSQPSYFDKPPSTPRPQPIQQDPMLENSPVIPNPMTAPDYSALDKMPPTTDLTSPQMPPTPGAITSNQSQANFHMVKSPVGTQAGIPLPLQQQPPRPTHMPLQSPLRSPPAFFSQASQSPMSSISTPIQSVPQQQETDIDLKDDIAFLDELFQAKLNEPSEKQDHISQSNSRKNSMSRAPNPMPVLDGMHSSAPSPTIPPNMPVLAPSVPPPSTVPKFDGGMGDTNHGIIQSQMQSMQPMPFPMQMPGGPMPMYGGVQDQSHLMMMHNMYGMNYSMMPSIRPPQIRNAKEKAKSNKSSALKGSDHGPAAKRKKVRRKSSESDTLVPSPSPKTPVTPATPNSTSNPTIVNPASNVSSVNSGESIAAVNPFMLDDNPADNAATRRSLRERKKKNYNDDYDYNISDDEEKKKSENGGEQVNIDPAAGGGLGGHKLIPYKPSDAVEGEIAIVEKILACRIRSNIKDEEGNEEEEFCVKYKGYSYLHCEWGSEKELSKKDKRVPMKIKRFKTKRDPVAILSELDDEPFNPDFVEVDRVLDQSSCIDQVTGETVTHYLVKWRSLPYEDSTWELEVNVDEPKIKQYLELKKPPPSEFQKYVPRPQAFQWKKIEKSPEYKDGNTLRDYQLEGLNWLSFCWYKRQNCILADEMGLGKTVQSISLLCELKRYGVRGPFLVIAPLSTIVHWQREFETWTDINTIVYHGSAPSRLLIQQYEMSYTNEKGEKIPGFYKFEAVVTTYEMVLSDNDMLSKIPWRCAVIDEAHRLKNKNCKLLEGLNRLQLEHRVLLTGTPLQNNVEELFSLLNFLEPTRFPSQAAFLLEFGNLKTEAQVEKLQQILKPMMLRRLKDDVEKNVPPKEETIIEVELTTIQKKFYRAILEKNLAFLTRGLSTTGNTPNLMNAMMELRKCCNHPFLINGAEERIVSEYTDGAEGHETITKHFKAMTESSGKMVLIDKLLPKLKSGGHKVLIFSQMIRVLDLLEDYLLCKKYLYERIDGRVRGNARQAAIDRFCRLDSDRFVFLLCTRAGGLGINLTAADTVIIFDSDWNPQNDLQAQARCHRIGQSKPVKIYRLICRNTYERDMFDKASRKLALDRAVLQNMNYIESSPVSSLPANTIPGGALPGSSPYPGNGSIQGEASPINPSQLSQPVMSKKEIEDLLKRGAYGALMDEDGDASSKFCEEDIDQILERRTQIIQIIGEGKGSTFAKASFISNTAKMDIDIDDPDFWTKWAQKAAVDFDDMKKENLIIDKPRERKQTKRFGNEDGSAELSEAESGEEEEKPVVDAVRTAWSRVECFRVEKNMLVYGWGRWRDFLLHDNFKVQINERELEAIARTVLVFCLHHFKGDEKVKTFISSTVTKSVTRSRLIAMDIASKEAVKDEPYTPDSSDPSKQKKPVKASKRGTQNSKPVLVEAGADWKTVDPDSLIIDPGYRKHLAHNSKKILSRVKLLWCLRHEIIGSFAEKIVLGLPASDIALQVPHVDGDAPTAWWDVEADKSLLIGVFKHGYDKYSAIKTDPCLCFANKLRLSGSEVEKSTSFSPEHAAIERNEEDIANSGGKRKRKKREHDDNGFNSDDEVDRDDDAESFSMIESPMSAASPNATNDAMQNLHSSLKWPQPPDLNTRLRRLITGYLKGCEKEQMKLAQQEKDKEKRERQAQQLREKQLKKAEMALRWSRREVTDFYRVVTTFGVVYDEAAKTYDWSKFRKLAKLDKKDDERITAYFEEFSAMCRRVCNQSTPEDLETKRGENLEPISDERAHRVLHRVNLINTIRNKVLQHDNLDERLALCEPSNDFPPWWKAGTLDKELLLGVAKHGVGRTEFHLFSDESLCFKGILDSLAVQLKKRRQEQLAKQNQNKDMAPLDETVAVPRPVNSTAADSQTTSSTETPSSGVNADRQPVATQHENKPQAPVQTPPVQTPPTEEKDEFMDDKSVSKEAAEILAAWPKDKALLGRLEKICQCVLNNAWPKNARVELRTHGHNGQNHPTLPGSFDRADLMRQPAVNVGGEDGPRGEMAEGLLSPDKNFKVTSLDGLKITVKKKRRRRTKEQMAAAAAAKAQLAQVPPPEHLKFPENDGQMPGMLLPPNEKVKRRRKRKVDIADPNSSKVNPQSPQDEPPLKVVPHPVKYKSVAESGATDLEMTLNPSIILHVPANMDQRTGRMPSSVGSPPPHNVSNQSSASSFSPHLPERRNLSSPNFSHSIDSLVHSKPLAGTAPHARPSTIDHLPNVSRQRSTESPDSPYFRSPAQQPPSVPLPGPKPLQRTGKPDSISDRSDLRNKEVPWNAVSSSSYRLVDHTSVISPNVNPFDKSRSTGETNIFDMLPLHMQSSSSKDYKDSVLTYSNADMSMSTKPLKQNRELQPRGDTVTPPGLTKHLEGHKASAAMAALAAKLHSQQVSQGPRSKQSERYLPNKDKAPLLSYQGEENSPRTSMSSVMNIRSPPLPVTKSNTVSYGHSTAEETMSASMSVSTHMNSTVASSIVTANDPVKTTTVNVYSNNVPRTTNVESSKYKKGIAGHPHSMASLLGAHPTKNSPSIPVTSTSHQPPTHLAHRPSVEDAGKDTPSVQSIDQKHRISDRDVMRLAVANVQRSPAPDSSIYQQRPQPSVASSSQSPNTSGKINFQPSLTPTSTHQSVVPDKSAASVEANVDTTTPPAKLVASNFKPSSTEEVSPTGIAVTPASGHGRTIPASPRNMQVRSKGQRTTKAAQSRTVIKRPNPTISRPAVTNGDTSTSSKSIVSETHISTSVMGQQPAMSSASVHLPPTSNSASAKEKHPPTVAALSQTQQYTCKASDTVISKTSRIPASATATSVHGPVDSSVSPSVAKSSESQMKKPPLDRQEEVTSGLLKDKQLKPVASTSSAAEATSLLVTSPPSTISTQSSSHGLTTQITPSSSVLVRTVAHSVISSTANSSKPAPVLSSAKSSSAPSLDKKVTAPLTTPPSVIKFSLDTKPTASFSIQKSSSANSTIPALIKDLNLSKPKVIFASTCKTRPSKSSQALENAPTVLSIASAGASKAANIAASTTINSTISTNSSKKPINVQIVTATSNVVACLSAAAALSHVQSIVKASIGNPKSSSETSVVSTLLRVIPSLVKEQSSSTTAKGAAQSGSASVKPVTSVQTSQSSRLSGTKGSVASVPFSTAVKVTVVSSLGSEIGQTAKASKMHSETSLLRTVPVSSTTAANLNAKTTQRGPATGKQQQKGAPLHKQNKSQRPSSSTNATSDDESEASNNAPVASRTRPSTRRITSLSALGPGPMKKGGKSTPVSSPKGANVTSPKGATSSKGPGPFKSQALSPNSTKASASQGTSVVNAKAAGKSNVQSAPSSGERPSSTRKIISTGDSKTEFEQAKKGQESGTTQSGTVASTMPQTLSKLDSTVAALAKLNESITIPTTRTVTSATDRPKKQKRSLASIVTDLASKGAHQTTIPTTTSSSSTDKVARLPSNTDTSSRSTSSSSSETKISSEVVENAAANDLGQVEESPHVKETVDSCDAPQSLEKLEKKDTAQVRGGEPSKEARENASQLVTESKPASDIGNKSSKISEPVESKNDFSDSRITDQGVKDFSRELVSHNDTEHNYSEKASAATALNNQNIT